MIAILCSAVGVSNARTSYPSYTYDYWGEPVPAPQAYVSSLTISGEGMGIGSLADAQDLAVGNKGIYILDAGNDRIVCLSSEFEVIRIIEEFVNDGVVDRLSDPQGLFVTPDEHVYVADTGNARVVVLAHDGTFIREIGAPTSGVSGILRSDFIYRPLKVAVDESGRIYVISENEYEGLIVFLKDGQFDGFVGAPQVTPSVVELFWNRIATREQRERQSLFLPTVFRNIDVDPTGFIFGLKKGFAETDSIRRLNLSGVDTLKREGLNEPVGDVVQTQSEFVDVAAYESGLYSVLDKQAGRVFTYDSNGNLLYVFGGKGSREGLFSDPTAIDVLGDLILVLDRGKGCLVVFEPTRYAKAILLAVRLYRAGFYDASLATWNAVLRLNANYDLAYDGVGRALLRQGDYREAMTNFRLGSNRAGYSDALRHYRRDIIESYFGYFMSGIIVLVVVALIYRALAGRRKAEAVMSSKPEHLRAAYPRDSRTSGMSAAGRRLVQRLLYSFHVSFHPFDGFYELRHGGMGSVGAASCLLLILVFTFILKTQYTGFIFNTANLHRINVIREALSILVPFALWCVVNWALTTLMSGKGTIRDIFIATAYAFQPMVVIGIPLMIASNVLVVEESAFYYLVNAFAMIWSVILLLIAVMVTHEFSFTKAIGSGILSITGMAIVLFFGLLFVLQVNELYSFFKTVYLEFRYRL